MYGVRQWLEISLLALTASSASAGDPRYVAGSSYFDPSVKGVPLTWAQGQVSYYADQGDLSPILPHAGADALVADSFSRWTSVPTAAVSATLAGQLGEDVNGTNVTLDGTGAIAMPIDIQPGARNKPVGIVYDADGAVTDALLGSGAGLSGNCFTNSVFGGVDNFTTDGHLAHALVVMNGNCAQTSSDLPELQYRLVRVLGQVLGLDWSQLNLNVITGHPQAPTVDDRAGFPVMHYMDSTACVPITRCYSTPDQPKMDDRASLSRLYPVTPQNEGGFPGKTVFSDNTARVQGSVYFVDGAGQRGQPMQGVNVVARWVDPTTNRASGQYAVSSISGFLFRGNAGNTVTGLFDATGQSLDRFGTDDVSLEGHFDLAGLEIPNGSATATYELSVEAVDPTWSEGVGPYGPWQVKPSGTFQPMRVIVTKGASLQQNILTSGSAAQPLDPREPESYSQPAAVPAGGDWTGSLSGYGDADYYWFAGQANRIMSVEVSALDESDAVSQDKARPVIGMWAVSTPQGSDPGAGTPTAFNTTTYGLSRLDALLQQSTKFRIGVADERGDGRPDYRYRMRVLYGDKVIPDRVSVAGGTVFAVDGMGFRPGMSLTVGSMKANILSTTSNQLVASAPAMLDGVRSLTISDPATGGATVLPNALTHGAAPDDLLQLLVGANPQTPAGTEARNPVAVRVVRSDGITPVAGASVMFSAPAGANLSACSGASTCTVLSNESGEISSRITPAVAGVYTIDVLLAPASYSPAKSVQATLSAVSSALDIAAVRSYRWVAEGANVDLPLGVTVVSNGSPVAGQNIAFAISAGTGTLTVGNGRTGANGFVTTTLQVRDLAAQIQVTACVSPAGAPCAIVRINKVALTDVRLQPVAGSAQLVNVGQAFQPVVIRAIDLSIPSNPVEGASVGFSAAVFRPDLDVFDEPIGETQGGTTAMPVLLDSWQSTITSDADGIASVIPSPGQASGPVEIEILAAAGASASHLFEVESMEPIAGSSGTGQNSPSPQPRNPRTSRSGTRTNEPRTPRPRLRQQSPNW
jgi:hypothetical protein